MNPMRLSRECLMDGCSLAKASAELQLAQTILTEALVRLAGRASEPVKPE